MAKLNSRLNAKPPIPAWKKLHHWQGLGLVLLMLPLGTALILGSAALEQANQQGLPEAGWTDELAQDLSTRLAGMAMGKGKGMALSEAPKLLSLKRRQRRVIKTEIDDLSEQTHQRLAEAIAQQASSTINSPADSNIVARANPRLSPPSQTSPTPSQPPRLAIAPDLQHRPNGPSAQANPSPHSPATVERFLAIALGTEFSPSGHPLGIPHIRKWTQDLRIQIHGQPTPRDIATLEQVVAEVNHLLGNIELGFVEQTPNLDIFFVAERDFSQYEASYRPVNHGFFWSEADQGAIQRGRILISTTDISQTERSHLIREELTQSLGLMQDSLADANSIFFQGWSQTQSYSPQDRELLQMLYRPEIRPGMDAVALRQVLLGS